MIGEHSTEKTEIPMAGETAFEFGISENHLATKRKVFSREEVARCMTLEESERLITEKIYRYYHPET